MAKSYFLINLRSDTYNPTFLKAFRPAGYLLAPNFATRTTRILAQQIRAGRYRFVVDNGNFSHIETIRDYFAQNAQSLLVEVMKIEQQLGRSLRPSDDLGLLRPAYQNLAEEVGYMATQLTGNGEENLLAQLDLNPAALVGVENINMASWLSLNIEPSYLGFPRSTYRSINRSVARKAAKQKNQLPESLSKEYYPVASAFSYNTAWDAGREFAREGLEKISLGFGAFMADDNWTDYVEIGRRIIVFNERFPNRYVRTVAVAKGFWDGYTSQMGYPPQAFHFLGLGAPIMIPLVTLSAWDTPDLTFDATSPIKDAVQGGTLYVLKPAYLKVRTRNVAYRLASDPTAEWDCPCPFCQEFMNTYPFRRDIGFTWWKSTRAKEVTAQDLRLNGALFSAYPLLCEPGRGSLRTAVNQARIGHNHWILNEITAKLRRLRSREAIRSAVEGIIKDYEANTKADRYARAIRFAYNLTSSSHA